MTKEKGKHPGLGKQNQHLKQYPNLQHHQFLWRTHANVHALQFFQGGIGRVRPSTQPGLKKYPDVRGKRNNDKDEECNPFPVS